MFWMSLLFCICSSIGWMEFSGYRVKLGDKADVGWKYSLPHLALCIFLHTWENWRTQVTMCSLTLLVQFRAWGSVHGAWYAEGSLTLSPSEPFLSPEDTIDQTSSLSHSCKSRASLSQLAKAGVAESWNYPMSEAAGFDRYFQTQCRGCLTT